MVPSFRILMAMIFIFSSSMAQGQSRVDAAANCKFAIGQSDLVTASAIALEIRNWVRVYSPNLLRDAEACLNFSFEETWAYSRDAGKFISGAEALALLRQNEAKLWVAENKERVEILVANLNCKVQQLERDLIRLEGELRLVQRTQQLEANMATFRACENAYETDRNAALLNPVCNELFSENGIPDSKFDFNMVELETVRLEIYGLEAEIRKNKALIELPSAVLEVSSEQHC